MAEIVRTLSRHQWEFLKLVVMGATDKQTAFFMVISPHTIRHYFRQLFQYTGFHNRTELAVWGSQFVVIPKNKN